MIQIGSVYLGSHGREAQENCLEEIYWMTYGKLYLWFFYFLVLCGKSRVEHKAVNAVVTFEK
jgi:hypothetical protein